MSAFLCTYIHLVSCMPSITHIFHHYFPKYNIYPYYNRIENVWNLGKNEKVIEHTRQTYTFEKQFKKWWKSPYVKFLCCSCYQKATNTYP